MQAVSLTFYLPENRRHDGIPLYEWLLEEGKRLGFHGGSAFRAIAGFGRHGVLHEESFFELAGELPIEVVFIISPAEVEQLFALLQQERL
ncbi:MAG: DUF190 domain-containing protein, partial [Sulfuricellaceae bacterium]|nr:DUF190 domain-containing protein [Sulfuricellaceae bacterium]